MFRSEAPHRRRTGRRASSRRHASSRDFEIDDPARAVGSGTSRARGSPGVRGSSRPRRFARRRSGSRSRAPRRSGAGSARATRPPPAIREGEETRDRVLKTRRLGRPPQEPEDLGRREPEEERHDAHRRKRPETSDSAQSWLVVKTETRAPGDQRGRPARKCIRLRATVGWARPARQRLEAATIESTVQCTKKTITKAWNAPLRA